MKGRIENFTVLNGKSSEYYLVSLDRVYDEAVYNQLAFIWISRTKKILYSVSLNRLSWNALIYLKVITMIIMEIPLRVLIPSLESDFTWLQTTILWLGKDIRTGQNLTFDLGANSYIDIGEGTRFHAPSQIEARDFESSMSLVIRNNCVFNGGALFRFFNPASALINDSCTSSSHFGLQCQPRKKK